MDLKATKTHLAQEQLADLLLDPAAASPAAREHVAACAECGQELHELQATMQAMDAWEAPEPTPYFDTRLAARLREEKANPPASLWERMRARLLYGSNLQLRPIAAGALALSADDGRRHRSLGAARRTAAGLRRSLLPCMICSCSMATRRSISS